MKRIISVLLCMITVFSCVTLLTSCSKGDGTEPQVSGKTIDINITDYTVVYGSELTTGGKQQVVNMTQMIKMLTSVSMRTQQDNESEEVQTEDLEILIGQTSRTETAKALKSIKGAGWTVRVFDNKLVIAGTTPFLTRTALSWFTENYLTAEKAKDSTLSVNKKVVLSNIETISLTKLVDGTEQGQYIVVYDDSVDDKVNSKNYQIDTNPPGGSATDYIYDLSKSVQSLLSSTTKAKASTFPFKVASTEASDYEILVGSMNRAEMREERSKLQVNEYAVAIRNGKIMLVAWNDVTLASTYALFEDLLKGCAVVDEEGNTTYMIPANARIKDQIATDWVIDFPKPEGENISLDGTVDVYNNSIEYIYSGSGVNRESYVAYCEKLEAAGFGLLAAETQWAGSSFRTYLNEETGVTLHVYHAAYTHAAEQNVTDVINSIRIVAATTDDVTVPDAEILTRQSYDVVTDSMITAVDLDYQYGESANFGLAQIITLADGSFIIVDGGQGSLTDDETNLWGVLNNLYKKIYGEDATPSKEKPIYVRGWIITHDHGDHYGVFTKFVKKYGSNEKFKMDYLFFNSASDSELYNSENPGYTVRKNMNSLQSAVTGGFKYIKVHTGQVFYLANCRLEVLYTHEDIYPRKVEYFNNTTTVIRTVLIETDGSKTYESGCVWLGDVERIGSSRMRAMYGDFMQTEMVQVAHHASNGAESALYDLIAPSVVWLPTDKGRYQSMCVNQPSSSKDWRYHVDYKLCQQTASVKMIVVADVYDTTLPITADGPQYDRMFNANDGKSVGPDNIVIIDKRTN